MKKLALTVLALFVFVMLSSGVYADSYSISIDGKALTIPSDMGTPFLDANGRVQAPVRALAESLNCKVVWDAASRTVTITRPDGMVVKLTVGSVLINTDLGDLKMDTSPQNVGGRIYIPVRFAANALGYNVDYKKDGGIGKISIAKSDKKVVGELTQPQPVYSIYRDVLGSHFRSTDYSAVCVDLDGDGMEELAVAQVQKDDYNSLALFVYKGEKKLGEIDLGSYPGSYSMDLGVSAGSDGKNYLTLGSGDMHQGWNNEYIGVYGIQNGVFKQLHSASMTTGPKDNDWEKLEFVSYVTIDGRDSTSQADFNNFTAKYTNLYSLCGFFNAEFRDDTDSGKLIYEKASEEDKLNTAANQELKDKRLTAGLKELTGLNLFDSCDTNRLEYYGEDEGTSAYFLPGREDVVLFIGFDILGSVYIEYQDEVIPVFGIKIGESKKSEVEKVLGQGREVGADSAYIGNPPDLSSCVIYSDTYTELWIYYNSDGTAIAAFVKGLQM